MEYVEMLRARRVLTWYGGIVFALLAIGLALAFKDGSPQIQMSHDANPRIGWDEIVAGSAFAPLVIAAFLGVGLDAEYKTTAIAWTRPISRYAIALRYIAIDGAAMIIAWVAALAAAFISIFALGLNKYLIPGSEALTYILLAFGVALMWYGLVVLLSALLPGRGNAVVGLSWAYAFIVPGITQIPFPPLLRSTVGLLNYLDPLAYLGGAINSSHHSLIVGTFTEHLIVTWLIGLGTIAIGTRIWATREVPA
ncbi:MAG: hypothetical protein PVSMB8_17040 [Vulcanimicrobiaceae bacterium]